MILFEPLTERHDIETFRSGGSYLDYYLQNEALGEQANDLARTFVAVDKGRAWRPERQSATLSLRAKERHGISTAEGQRFLLGTIFDERIRSFSMVRIHAMS